MTTALDVIKRSMRLLTVLGQSETPTDSEAEDGLNAMNTMLDAWSLEKLMVYQIQQEQFTWPSATISRTIGDTGNFVTTRPVKIEGGFTRLSGNDYPFRVIDRDAYDALSIKTAPAAWPDYLFYDTGLPLGTIYLYGVPSSPLTIFLNTRKQLTQAAALNTTLVLAPGYKRAIEYNLAIEYGAEFNKPIPPDVARISVESKRAIKNVNARAIVSQMDPGIVNGSRSNIFTG